MPPIIARFRWSEEDLLNGRKLYLRSINRRFFNWWLTVLAIVAFCAGNYRPGDKYNATLVVTGIFIFAVTVAVLIVTKLISPRLRKREFTRRPDANQLMEWSFTDEQIISISPGSKTETTWPVLYKVRAAPTGFLFFINEQIYFYLPARAFSSPADFDSLKSLASQYVKDFKELA